MGRVLTDHDEPDPDVTERWVAYKAQCRDRRIQPMRWGEWLRDGQPIYDGGRLTRR